VDNIACKSSEGGQTGMGKIKKTRDAAFKAKVAFEAATGQKTIAQLASEYGVHPNQIGQWKKKLLEELPMLFIDKRVRGRDKEREELEAELYKQIGQLKVELEWLKKKSQTLQLRRNGH
jgi:putative transposase